MNKTELIGAMSEKSGLSRKDSEKALNAMLDSIVEALKDDDKVQLVGFGSFDVRQRPAREGRNPHTGETMQIPASRVPQFKAGKNLKDIIAKR